MQHLTLETLARLADEPPSAAEAEHLAECALCRAERDALREQTRALAALPRVNPRAIAWPALAERLEREDLLRTRTGARSWWARAPIAVAASLALFLLGGVTGAAVAGRTPTAASPVATVAPPADRVTAEQALREAEFAYRTALGRYNELAGAGSGAEPAARLAAMESIVLTTTAALREAPADPVLNGYHLVALEQRNETLRQMARQTEQSWY